MCDGCGRYKGRVVVDVAQKEAKKAERIARKRTAKGLEAEAPQETTAKDSSTEAEADTSKASKK